MKNKEFDALIKKQLETFESKQVAPDWNKMQSIIDNEKSNQAFDKLVKHTLLHTEAYSSAASWENFELKREIYQSRRRHIINTRLVECCILILLIWTANSFLIPGFQTPNESRVIPYAQQENKKELNNNKNSSSVNISTEFKNSEYSNIQKHSNVNRINKYLGLVKSKLNFTGKQIKEKLFSAKNNSGPSNNNINSNSLATVASTTVLHELQNITNNPQVNTLSKNQVINSFVSSPLSGEDIAKIATLSPSEIAITDPLNLRDKLIQKPVIAQFNTCWHLDYFIGSTAMHIHRPSEETNIGKDIYQWANVPVAGLYILKQHENWDVGTGLEYKSISYAPGKSEKLGDFNAGYYQQYLKSMNFNVINIPILIYKKLIETQNFSLRAKFGTGLSMNLKSTFKQEESSTIPSLFQGQSALSAKIADKGILKGGKFGNNSYLSIDFGVRSEYNLNKRMKLFAEINTDLMLNALGFGPYKDQYKGVGMNLGIKSIL